MRVCVQWFVQNVAQQAGPLMRRALQSPSTTPPVVAGIEGSVPAGTTDADDDTALTVLLFNCGHEKSALELLLPLSTVRFDHVLIAPFDASRPSRLGYPEHSAVVDMYFTEKALRAASSAATASAPAASVAAASTPSSASSAWTASFPDATSTVSTSATAWQSTLATLWSRLFSDTETFQSLRRTEMTLTRSGPGKLCDLPVQVKPPVVLPSIADALAHVRGICAANPRRHVRVLVTGSLYLVGGVLSKVL